MTADFFQNFDLYGNHSKNNGSCGYIITHSWWTAHMTSIVVNFAGHRSEWKIYIILVYIIDIHPNIWRWKPFLTHVMSTSECITQMTTIVVISAIRQYYATAWLQIVFAWLTFMFIITFVACFGVCHPIVCWNRRNDYNSSQFSHSSTYRKKIDILS